MAYRHLTTEELDALCDDYEVLRNLREAARRSTDVYAAALGTSPFRRLLFEGGNAEIRKAEHPFWSAQRDYHNTARVLAGLKPYR